MPKKACPCMYCENSYLACDFDHFCLQTAEYQDNCENTGYSCFEVEDHLKTVMLEHCEQFKSILGDSKMSKWTYFFDMHSGGGRKQKFEILFVQLPEKEAVEWFTERYGNPRNVTCSCCGPDYSRAEEEVRDDQIHDFLENNYHIKHYGGLAKALKDGFAYVIYKEEM